VIAGHLNYKTQYPTNMSSAAASSQSTGQSSVANSSEGAVFGFCVAARIIAKIPALTTKESVGHECTIVSKSASFPASGQSAAPALRAVSLEIVSRLA
jgi:hypothetical protein